MVEGNVDFTLLAMDTPQDSDLLAVEQAIIQITDFTARVARVLRNAFDEVIDGPRTLRWSVNDLEKVEKTYIGTKVELLLRSEMGFAPGKSQDYLIVGQEVDAKFTLKPWGWMIPSEALGHICLLTFADDMIGRFDCGLIRAKDTYMTAGKNKDGKRHIAAEHRSHIRWLARNAGFPRNFLMHHLAASRRDAIFKRPPGQERVNALFEVVQNQPIPAEAIAAVAREEVDVPNRAAEARCALKDSLYILSGDDPRDQQVALDHRLLAPEAGQYMSVSRYLVGRLKP